MKQPFFCEKSLVRMLATYSCDENKNCLSQMLGFLFLQFHTIPGIDCSGSDCAGLYNVGFVYAKIYPVHVAFFATLSVGMYII
jgi:hypothetical protein